MKKGTFNKIVRFGNLVLKLSTEHNSIATEMLKLDSKNVSRYEKDINQVGINTSKVYLSLKFNDKNLIIQEFIDGQTVQEYLDSNDVSSRAKLVIFKRIIEMYGMSLSNPNLCLDWNLNNFIIQNNDIYYVDYVPALYKNKINNVHSELLQEYQLSLIDKHVQLAGIVCHAIIPFFTSPKTELKEVYFSMKEMIEEILGVKMDYTSNFDHTYIKKMMLLEEYLTTNQDEHEFSEKYNSISMLKTAHKKVLS